MVSETSKSRYVVSYLGLLIDISNGDLELFAQFLERGMHLILILSIFLTYLGIFSSPSSCYIHLKADKKRSGLP